MKCYYEELSLARDANDADIKTAYRKLALRWHPDKNPECLEQAKERFQLIQQAYEVLSDPQERAWYDNHREQILRGKNSDYEENCLDLYQYFTVSCYKGFGDDEKGFYAVYREVFTKIAAEDLEFLDDEEEMAQVPSFGNSKDKYEEVVGPFYAYWQAYCTKKTYTWLCPYDIQEIKDRRVLRVIEKDMKKVVTKARRERNEEVRQLVSFVRKRDRRVHAYKQILEERATLNRQKQEKNRLEQIRKRQREVEEMRQSSNNTFNEGYEEQLKQLEEHYGTDSSSVTEDENGSEKQEGEDESDEDYVDDLYCVACNKAFTNEKAYANHETSKKHRDNIERLTQEMKSEEDAYNGDENDEIDSLEDDLNEDVEEIEINSEDDEELIATSTEDEEPTQSLKTKNQKKKKSKGSTVELDINPNLEVADSHESLTEEVEDGPKTKQNRKQKKSKRNKNVEEFQPDADEEKLIEPPAIDGMDNDDELAQLQKKQNRKQKKSKKVANKTNESLLATNSDQEEIIEERLKKAIALESSDNEDWTSGSVKKSARKQKNKAKKMTESKATPETNKEIESPQPSVEKPTSSNPTVANSTTLTSHVCATCKSCFDSKNKLFSHLKKTNHGVYLPREKPTEATTTVTGNKKSAKSKRK